ncbi:MAG: hypothetical protein KAG66_07710, partial [Methylococcales bacterium]|nr:hypothetical protein [Methylococcales bacterium]
EIETDATTTTGAESEDTTESTSNFESETHQLDESIEEATSSSVSERVETLRPEIVTLVETVREKELVHAQEIAAVNALPEKTPEAPASEQNTTTNSRARPTGWVSENLVLSPTQRKHLSIDSALYIVRLEKHVSENDHTSRTEVGTTEGDLLTRLNEYADENDVVELIQCWYITDASGNENPPMFNKISDGIRKLGLGLAHHADTHVNDPQTITSRATMYLNGNKDVFRRQKVKQCFIDKLNEQYARILLR